ncbi:MAG: primosomal protein N' [Lachnospira sp.]|nr:primosomal protein N' [Lachnospira sp.]
MYADIIVDIMTDQLDKPFQYKVPSEMESDIGVGVLVTAPFGAGNRLITGYVIELHEEPRYDPNKTKCLTDIVHSKVKIVERMIKLAAWLKNNYGSTMNQALRTVIPVKDKIKAKEKKSVRLVADEETVEDYLTQLGAKKNAVARVRLLEALKEEPIIEYEIIKTKLNIGDSAVKTLEKAGLVEIVAESLYRNPVDEQVGEEKRVMLNEQQRKAVDTFVKDYSEGIRKTYLLHGITGSGKTVCYMDMIEHVINEGRQVIVLIPEIALTFQTVQRFYRRFGDRVSIMNSRMSKGERYDQFLRAMRGEISIMIGPRSALFTPFADIGLIVIDEEHENAYKSETAPRYHARETAVYIAKECNASVVLGSATPSMEAYYRAMEGEYQLFELNDRATGGKLATVHTVDLRQELKDGNRSMFSRKLQELIEDRLAKNEQIMLFLNKRGYAGFVSCRSCGHVMKCPHCDISLTEHRNGKLICHYCGYEQAKVTECPECGSKYISGFKAGTQQVEEAIARRYPGARVLRMDMDTTSTKDGHEKILAAFANHEADILVGTQMIVKGHDFPEVTLVGVLAADMSLHVGDYRAAEKTFQLLVQAAGRAGRGSRAGEVVIQTFSPDNYSVEAAGRQDYKGFYEEEIAYRSLMGYPPVRNMLKVSFTSKNVEKLEKACEEVKIKMQTCMKKGIICVGPVPAGIYKINDEYTQVMHIKAADYEELKVCKDFLENDVRADGVFDDIYLNYDFN